MNLAFSKATDELDVLFGEFDKVGYEGLQLKPGQYQPYLDSPHEFLDEHGHAKGAASALIGYGPLDEENTELLHKTFRFGQKVGAERVVFCHARDRDGVSDDDIKGFARTFSELGDEALGHGIKLSLHHHNNQPVMRRPDFDLFFGNAKPGTVGLTVDTAHLILSGVDDVAGIIRDFRSVIDNFHMKDIEDGEFKVLGTGNLDFGPVFAAIKEIGYDGWISADEESGAEVKQAMEQCIEFMKRGMR